MIIIRLLAGAVTLLAGVGVGMAASLEPGAALGAIRTIVSTERDGVSITATTTVGAGTVSVTIKPPTTTTTVSSTATTPTTPTITTTTKPATTTITRPATTTTVTRTGTTTTARPAATTTTTTGTTPTTKSQSLSAPTGASDDPPAAGPDAGDARQATGSAVSGGGSHRTPSSQGGGDVVRLIAGAQPASPRGAGAHRSQLPTQAATAGGGPGTPYPAGQAGTAPTTSLPFSVSTPLGSTTLPGRASRQRSRGLLAAASSQETGVSNRPVAFRAPAGRGISAVVMIEIAALALVAIFPLVAFGGPAWARVEAAIVRRRLQR